MPRVRLYVHGLHEHATKNTLMLVPGLTGGLATTSCNGEEHESELLTQTLAARFLRRIKRD